MKKKMDEHDDKWKFVLQDWKERVIIMTKNNLNNFWKSAPIKQIHLTQCLLKVVFRVLSISCARTSVKNWYFVKNFGQTILSHV